MSVMLFLQAYARNVGAADKRPMPENGTMEYLDVVKVIIQVCLPNKVVAFEDQKIDLTGTPEEKTSFEVYSSISAKGHKNVSTKRAPVLQGDHDVVRKWIPELGDDQIDKGWLRLGYILDRQGYSASMDTINLFDSTEKHQPIYEIEGYRQKDYVAFEIVADKLVGGERQGVSYWYKLPAVVPTGAFSRWQEPISEETKAIKDSQKEHTWSKLVDGREMDIYPVGPWAPKMRFKLMTVEDYHDENRFWRRSQRAIGETVYRGELAELRTRGQLRFVPKRNAAIPGC